MSFQREQIDEDDDEEHSPDAKRGMLIRDEFQAHDSEDEQRDVLQMAEEMKIPDNDDLISEMSARIPVLHQKAAPKVLDGKTLIDMR